MAARVPFDALGRAVPEPGQKEGTHGSTGPWGAVGRASGFRARTRSPRGSTGPRGAAGWVSRLARVSSRASARTSGEWAYDAAAFVVSFAIA